MKDIKDTVIDRLGCSVDIFLENSNGLERVFYPADEKNQFTLEDIYIAFNDHPMMIYVFCDRGLNGEIYRCGNYGKGIWQKYAVTQGYA
ncbi:hypothetical protein J9537_00910 [Enterococcus raffinosus]|uniref:hypothetical protein n=1 Tax=Enterococcus raffinosus TaxID=71452 RepID=UPI001C43C5A2|nr:hypothetical protein [Enterococcus raffinosus]QXJ59381.1 hypothetical protein J9537_00910 [Enterococcus raffinosus]